MDSIENKKKFQVLIYYNLENIVGEFRSPQALALQILTVDNETKPLISMLLQKNAKWIKNLHNS